MTEPGKKPPVWMKVLGPLVSAIGFLVLLGYIAFQAGIAILICYAVIRFADGKLLLDLCDLGGPHRTGTACQLQLWLDQQPFVTLAPRVPVWLVATGIICLMLLGWLETIKDWLGSFAVDEESFASNVNRIQTMLAWPGFLIALFLIVVYFVWWPLKLAIAFGAFGGFKF